MTDPPPPPSPPSPPPKKSGGRPRDIGFGLLGILAVCLGIVLADLSFDDADPVFPEPIAEIPVAADATGDPGGAVVAVEVEGAGPLFEDATAVQPTEFDQDGNPVPPPATGEPGGGGQGPGGAPGGDDGEGPGAGATDPAPGGGQTGNVVGRWLDACADSPGPACPIGVGGTIDEVIPLQIRVLPDATAAQLSGLRCDLGWRSADTIPFVVLSTRPASIEIELFDGQGALVGFIATNTSPTEITAWEQRRTTNPQAIAPNLDAGVHICADIRLGTPLSEVPTYDRDGSFVARVTARSTPPPQQHTTEKPFTGSHTELRPRTRLLPVNEGHAYLTVSHSENERIGLWVYDGADPNAPESCETLTHGPLSDLLEPVTSTPVAVDPEILGRPDYPWDPQYSHYSQWLLKLKPSSRYTVCVQRVTEASVEEWAVETPDGVTLEVVAGVLAHETHVGAGELDLAFVGLPGCVWAQFSLGRLPDQDQPGKGGYHQAAGDVLCETPGPVDDRFYLGPFINGGYAGHPSPYGHFRERVVEHCVNNPLRPEDEGWCQVMVTWYSLAWDPVYVLQIDFRATPVRTNNRPDPLKWGFSQVSP